jgi:CheY-like chemotaxis protein
VESAPGKGSRFWFTGIFQRTSEERPLSPMESRAHVLEGRLALVVDDNTSNRLIVRELLTDWRLEVDEADEAEAAMKRVAAAADAGRPYDVVLLDLAMPGRDGLELASMIREQLRDEGPRLMLLTSAPVDTTELAEVGIKVSLAKPLSGSALFNGLVDCLADSYGAESLVPVPAEPPREHRGKHLLVVEDNEVNQIVALGVLETLGYTADVADDGALAVEMASGGAYDAILMDVQMPRMDGYDATRRIRRQEGTGQHVPIIAMTAAALEGERQKCLEAGMDDFLTKPIEPDRLDAALNHWLSAVGEGPTNGDETALVDGTEQRATVLDPARLAVLAEMGSGASSIVDKAVTNFISGASEALAEITTAVRRHDAGRLRSSSHRLKGSALNLGATAVAQLCLELELLGDAGDTSHAAALVGELEQALRNAADALRDYQDAALRS